MVVALVNSSNIVENLIVANSMDVAVNYPSHTCVDATESPEVMIGWTWNGTIFSGPE